MDRVSFIKPNHGDFTTKMTSCHPTLGFAYDDTTNRLASHNLMNFTSESRHTLRSPPFLASFERSSRFSVLKLDWLASTSSKVMKQLRYGVAFNLLGYLATFLVRTIPNDNLTGLTMKWQTRCLKNSLMNSNEVSGHFFDIFLCEPQIDQFKQTTPLRSCFADLTRRQCVLSDDDIAIRYLNSFFN